MGKKDFCLKHHPALGQSRTSQVRTAMPTPPRFAPPLVCRALRRLGRPHSRGRMRVGALLGWVPGPSFERLPFGRRRRGPGFVENVFSQDTIRDATSVSHGHCREPVGLAVWGSGTSRMR